MASHLQILALALGTNAGLLSVENSIRLQRNLQWNEGPVEISGEMGLEKAGEHMEEKVPKSELPPMHMTLRFSLSSS